jgi:hypothetical protein
VLRRLLRQRSHGIREEIKITKAMWGWPGYCERMHEMTVSGFRVLRKDGWRYEVCKQYLAHDICEVLGLHLPLDISDLVVKFLNWDQYGIRCRLLQCEKLHLFETHEVWEKRLEKVNVIPALQKPILQFHI